MTKGNQLDGIVDFEKSINYQGFTYSTFIEFCPDIKIKRRSRKTVNYLGRHDRNQSDSILEFTSFIQRFSSDSVYHYNNCNDVFSDTILSYENLLVTLDSKSKKYQLMLSKIIT
jgi:hypothetical protein